MEGAEKKCNHDKGGKNETVAALAVGFICLIVGIPLWWKTTTTYRATLPFTDITQIYQQATYCTIPVTVVSCDHHSDLGKELETFLHAGNDGRQSSLGIQYSIYSRKCLSTEKRLLEEAESLKDWDAKLQSLHHDSVGQILVFFLGGSPAIFKDQTSHVYVGQHRSIFAKGPDSRKVLESVAVLIRTVMVSEKSLTKHYMTARGVVRTVADLESMRSFRYTPGYELSFTLLLPEPQNIMAEWDFTKAQSGYLDPMLNTFKEFAEFSVTSQVLYYAGLSVKPKKSADKSSFFFPHGSLPHIITPVEAKLGSHVTNFPNLNFVVYIPPLDQTPLYIHSESGSPVGTNAFLSPRWGGVLIHNIQQGAENMSRPIRAQVDSDAVMPVFLSQLRLLLGIPNPTEISSVNIETPDEQSVLDWEYDSLLRRHCIENLASSSASLFSLSQLLEKIGNIVINDDIAKQVYIAVASIKSGHRFLQNGQLHSAFHASKTAVIASEKAFFDPSLLELLYFPDDQKANLELEDNLEAGLISAEKKFAIYIPLFLPVSIPVILSVVKAVQWIRQRRSHQKDKAD